MRKLLILIAVLLSLLAPMRTDAQTVSVTVVASGTSDVQAFEPIVTPARGAWLVGFSITEDAGSTVTCAATIGGGTFDYLVIE